MITVQTPPQPLVCKLAAVVSDKLEIGVAMNALAHMSLGLGTILGPDNGKMCDYVDASGNSHPSISAYPYIILKGRPGKIREAVETAKAQGIQVVDFVDTMTVGTYLEQLQRTQAAEHDALNYYGAAFFGPLEAVTALTKKFSLFR